MSIYKERHTLTIGKTDVKAKIIKSNISSDRKFIDPNYPVGTQEDPFEKSKIESQIMARLAHKDAPNSQFRRKHPYPQQGRSSLCGPAAFMYALLIDCPEIYKKYIQNLWETGVAQLGDMTIKPSKSTRNPKNYTICNDENQQVDTTVPAIDWISLASLRDSENLVFSYGSPDDQVAGITMWGILSSWFEKVGAKKVFDNISITGSNLGDVLSLSNYVLYDYHVVTLIGAGMLYENGGVGKNHWVVWKGLPIVKRTGKPVTLTTPKNEIVTLTMFSWGEVLNHLKWNLTLEEFVRPLYGGMVFTRIPKGGKYE